MESITLQLFLIEANYADLIKYAAGEGMGRWTSSGCPLSADRSGTETGIPIKIAR
jgi:hypothetical protein